MLLDIIATISPINPGWNDLIDPIRRRAQRFADVQERLIAPDGSFPALGRSLCYRCGAFQHLAHMALARQLPDALPPAQVRAALTAVIRRTLHAPQTFDDLGFLTLGLAGHQPALAEPYISTGSLYLCSTALLPLGLPPSDPFWSLPALPFTSQKIWSGQNLLPDHALHD
jgi:hypothetical protein